MSAAPSPPASAGAGVPPSNPPPPPSSHPSLGQGVIALANVWRGLATAKRVPSIPSIEGERLLTLGSTGIRVTTDDAAAIDAATDRLLSITSGPDGVAFVAALSGSDVAEPMATALASFAEAIDAALPLSDDGFEAAMYASFRVLVKALRGAP